MTVSNISRILLATTFLVSAEHSLAQEAVPPAATDSGALEEILVTAQRREENLQKVPISVASASAAQLAASGVTNIQDLKIAVPGVQVQATAGYALPIIRGVGSRAAGAGLETPIGIYIDGVYYADATGNLLQFNNIARVEVLRGPQGTLFGRNATGGLIQVVTLDPKHTLGGNVNLSYGNYDTWSGQAYLTTGITDNVAADLSVMASTQGDGWGTNFFNGKDVYRNYHDISVRSKWLITAGDDTEIRLSADFQDGRNNFNTVRLARGEGAPAPFGPSYGGSQWDLNADAHPNFSNRSYGGSVRVDHDFSAFTLANITAYRENKADVYVDQDYSPYVGRILTIPQTGWQFSQELQLQSPSASPVKWVIGAFYFRARSRFDNFTIRFFNAAQPVNGPSTLAETHIFDYQDTKSLAGFGQATVPITDAFNITAGLRYTSETRALSARAFNVRANGDVVVTVPQNYKSDKASKLTWRLSADYNINDDVLAYVSYNRGFKSGGYNTTNLTQPPYTPEVLDAYEVGVKSSLFDRKVRLNTSFFYYDYQDVQVARAANGGIGIYNGAGEELYGVDLELEAQLSSQLNVALAYEYLHSEYTKFPGAQVATPNGAAGYLVTFRDISGNEGILTPESTISARANYTVPLGENKLDFNVSAYYNSGFYQEPDNVIRQPAYTLINASVRYSLASGLSVKGWINNITNRAVASYDAIQNYGGPGLRRNSFAAPRLYGVTLAKEF